MNKYQQQTVKRALSYINEEINNRYESNFENAESLTSSSMVREFLRIRLAHEEREHFDIILLDTQHKVMKCKRLFSGTINASSVYPREVVKLCLTHNAGAVIFAHNHPSGITEPSKADIDITRRLKQALELVEVRVLDHLVVGGDVTSLAERGLL